MGKNIWSRSEFYDNDCGKYCSMCRDFKPISGFTPTTSGFLNRHSRCIRCQTDLTNKYYHRKSISDPAWYSQHLEKSRRWGRENPGKQTAKSRRRTLEKAHRIPGWADIKMIRDFYEQCPPGFHCDHRIPLRGSSVSGLHVLQNLQYLPGKLNISKGNKCPTPLIGTDEEINKQIYDYFSKEN